MTGKTYNKIILLVIVLTMSFSSDSFAQIYSKPHASGRLPKDYPNKVTPNFDKKKSSYGVYIGMNTATFASSLWRDFSPALGFAFGFEFNYRKICGFINGGMSWGKTNREILAYEILPQGKPYYYGLTEFSLGYSVFENEPWRLCPFIGYSISEIGVNGLDAEISSVSMSKFCAIVGVSIDYKVYGDIFTLSRTGHQDYLEFNVKVRLYGSYLNFDENIKGYSINLLIGFSLIKRPLLVRGFSPGRSNL